MGFRIRTRLLLSYLFLIVIALSISGIAILFPLQNYYINHLEGELIKNGRLVSQIIKPYLIDGDYDRIDVIATELGSQIDTRVTIIKTNGEVLGESDQSISLMENHSDRPEFQGALRGEVGTSKRFSTTINTDTLYVALPLEYQGEIQAVIRVALPLMGIEQTLALLRGTFLIGFLIALTIAVLLSIIFSRTITRPIEVISKITEKISQGDLEQRVYTSSKDELALLSQAINEMTLSLKRQINEITASKQQLEAILSHMASGVMVINQNGQIQGINPEAERIFNIKEKEVLGNYYQGVIRNFTLLEIIDQVMEYGLSCTSHEFTIFYPVKLTLRAYAAPVINNEKIEQIVIVFHDITTLRQLEKMKTDFVANASHELRTPVASIKGFSETLMNGALEDKEVASRFVGIINKEADRLSRLISDLLELSRLEVKGGELSKTPTDVKKLLDETKESLTKHAEGKGVEVHIDINEELPEIQANGHMLLLAFDNLIDNAIKYTPKGGRIGIKGYIENNYLMLKFTDTGVGIPKEDLPRIFERFYRVDKARSQDVKGTGLGLSIVKHVMEQHKGYIHVQSQSGEGSTFTLTLPIK